MIAEQAGLVWIELVLDQELGWIFQSIVIVDVLLCGHWIPVASYSLNLYKRAPSSYDCGNCRMPETVCRLTGIVDTGRQKAFLHNPPDMSRCQYFAVCAGMQRAKQSRPWIVCLGMQIYPVSKRGLERRMDYDVIIRL